MFAIVTCAATAAAPLVLCRLLDSDDWATRERTTVLLVADWPRSAPTVRRAFYDQSPEVRNRAGQIAAAGIGGALRAGAARVARDAHAPCVDSLWYQVAAKQYSPATPFEHKMRDAYAPVIGVEYPTLGRVQDTFRGYRTATKRMACDLYAAGAPEWGVQSLLQWMYARDATYFGAAPGDNRLCPLAHQIVWPFGP